MLEQKILNVLKWYFDLNDKIDFEYEWVKWPTDEHRHWWLKVVSDKFIGKNKVERSKIIYSLLWIYLRDGSLHALRLNLKTFEEVTK